MEGFHLIELPKSRTLTVTLLLDNFYKKGIIMEFQRKKDSHNSAVLVKLSFRYKDPVVFNKCLHSQAFNSEYYPNGAYPKSVLFQFFAAQLVSRNKWYNNEVSTIQDSQNYTNLMKPSFLPKSTIVCVPISKFRI